MLTDKQIQRKLNQLVKIANELVEEAKRRYGQGNEHGKAGLFYEADGSFHLMSGDAEVDDGTDSGRQSYVQFSSKGYCEMGAGAW